jgi:hypothetical protein
MTVYKPRGPQKPRPELFGISHFALLNYIRNAQRLCEKHNEPDSALRFELMADYFEKYQPGKPMDMTGVSLGF